jgi:hypothetical protein
LEVEMAPIVDTPRQEPADEFEIAYTQEPGGVAEQLAERAAQLYAEEERADRRARTERLIREARDLQ